MDAFTAQQTTKLVSRIGCKEASMRIDDIFWDCVMTGPLFGFEQVCFFGPRIATFESYRRFYLQALIVLHV